MMRPIERLETVPRRLHVTRRKRWTGRGEQRASETKRNSPLCRRNDSCGARLFNLAWCRMVDRPAPMGRKRAAAQRHSADQLRLLYRTRSCNGRPDSYISGTPRKWAHANSLRGSRAGEFRLATTTKRKVTSALAAKVRLLAIADRRSQQFERRPKNSHTEMLYLH